MIREMRKYHGFRADTIYLGGGTPSLLSEESLEMLLSALRREFQITEDAEITMEVNPATVSREKLALCRRIGINRLSIGVQSLRADELAYLGRLHSPSEAIEAMKLAKSEGFSNLSADIIYLSLIHISEPTRQAEISYAVFCLKKKKKEQRNTTKA